MSVGGVGWLGWVVVTAELAAVWVEFVLEMVHAKVYVVTVKATAKALVEAEEL